MSVLSQSVPGPVEILVGDDSSTDDTFFVIEKVICKYPGNIKYIRREKNMGACLNLKDLVSSANGEFIAHLDGDDYWLPGKLNAQVSFLKKNSENQLFSKFYFIKTRL